MTRVTTDCPAVYAQLPALAAGELVAQEARALWAHLGTCRACRQEYAAFREAREALQELVPERAGPREGLGDDFFAALHADAVAAANGAAPLPSRRHRTAIMIAAAAVLFGVGLAWALLGSGRSAFFDIEPIDHVRPDYPANAAPVVSHIPATTVPLSEQPEAWRSEMGLEAQRRANGTVVLDLRRIYDHQFPPLLPPLELQEHWTATRPMDDSRTAAQRRR